MKELKVLMIGNSFSISVGKQLPAAVASVPEHHLLLCSAYIGGCSLETHWNNIKQAEKDPNYKPYMATLWDSATPSEKVFERDANVLELLPLEKWDVVTIQQASHESWNSQSYEPYATNLLKVVRQLAPQAKILIQQTWAYRCSDWRFCQNEATWDFGQQEMYDRLTAAYRKLSADHGNLEIIPTGKAVQLFRQNAQPPFQTPSPEEVAKYQWPDVPPQAGDIVGRYYWKEREGKWQLDEDSIHLNFRGEYLQACVWFAKLFGTSAQKISYVPRDFDPSFCQLCRDYADQVVF